MKIQMDFVTNSSSTAFCILGVKIDLYLFDELDLYDALDMYDALDYEKDYDNDTVYYGLPSNYININSNKSLKDIYDETSVKIMNKLKEKQENGFHIKEDHINIIMSTFNIYTVLKL